ncbi:MAG: TVP38/TMEM64 family protein [bacterium]|nr:TVP38/TMEM64 family protein [bacterium]
MDTIGIALFGWLPGFLYAQTGQMIGAFGAFLLSRRFGGRVLALIRIPHWALRWRQMLDRLDSLAEWTRFRLYTNLAFDIVSYLSGLTSVSWKRYLIATLLGNAPIMFVTYYLGGKGYQIGGFLGLIGVVLLTVGISKLVLSLLWRRYFESD